MAARPKNETLILPIWALVVGATTCFDVTHGAEAEASIKIQSVRVTRSSSALQTQFGGQYYADSSPGVSIHLLLKLRNMSLLAPGRDAIAIDTFIDDTYQNLLVSNQYGSSYGAQLPRVSEDGASVIFNVTSSQPPSDEAARIFIRGKLKVRVTRGSPKVEVGTLPLVVGQGARIGPFMTSLRTISASGENTFSLVLAVYGDTSRILKVRALDSSKARVLNDPRQTFFNRSQDNSTGFSQPSTTVSLTLREAVSNFVAIEYTVAETIEPVSVPFEAQVDLGVTKAGPLESSPQAPAGSGRASSRPWPPPAKSNAALPSSRSPFVPDPKVKVKAGDTNLLPTNRF